MKFDISTYKNYRVFYKGDEVEVVDSCFRNKVVICNEDDFCTLVSPEDLEMKFLLANFIHLHVNIYYKLEKFQGIALDVSDNIIVYIDKEGHLERSFLSDLRLMSDEDIESFDANLIKHNLYWDGSALKAITLDSFQPRYGLVTRESNNSSKMVSLLNAKFGSRNNVFHVGERVFLSTSLETTSGTHYLADHHDGKGWISKDNISIEEMEPYAEIEFMDDSHSKGYILDAQLPHITYINISGRKVSSESAVSYTIRDSVFREFCQCNHICSNSSGCKKIVTSCYSIYKKIKVTKCVKASTFNEVGLACGIKALPNVGIEGKTEHILQDYKGNLYYIMKSNDSFYLVLVSSTEEIK